MENDGIITRWQEGKYMKKIIVLFFALICISGFAGCNRNNKVNLDFPFEVEEIENVEMYHYAGVPIAAEKKLVVSSKNIKFLYEMFEGLSLEVKEIEELTGAAVISFRFNLSDGTNYELIYSGYGVKYGSLKSATGGFEYCTSADIIACWSSLNKELEAVSVEESELPKY